MDFKKYDKLRKKSNSKDFEGKNNDLDFWLYKFSFLGNGGSIFFAFFLIYPSLYKTISLHLVEGVWSNMLSIILTIFILVIFEITKRYLIRNFSNDFIENNKKIKPSNFAWFVITISLISLSFYFSITGSKNLATTSIIKNDNIENVFKSERDSLKRESDNRKELYLNRNNKLEIQNDSLLSEKSQIPENFYSKKSGIQKTIDRNEKEIESNLKKINEYDAELKFQIEKLEKKIEGTKTDNSVEDNQNIFLFVILVIFIELLIISGIYFREWYEYNLRLINQNKYEKLYLKKDRYQTLVSYVYNNGKYGVGDKVTPVLKLKELVSEKTKIQNSNKFIDEFFDEMDKHGIFTTNGKKRYIGMTYTDAMKIIDNFDDSLQILENMV
jgi:hypothetical protein